MVGYLKLKIFSSSLVEKILSFRYPTIFRSLRVSNGSFRNPNTFHTIICISLHCTSIFHMTILIAIMTYNLIVNRCILHKITLVKFLFQIRFITYATFVKYTFSMRVEDTLPTFPILMIFPFELSPKDTSPPFSILVKLENQE